MGRGMKASLETEVSHCDFGDQRLNARVVEVTTKL
ncbi:MAG: hypothetical protein ACI9HK_005970, partial [Pirellulaceae bacterium]